MSGSVHAPHAPHIHTCTGPDTFTLCISRFRSQAHTSSLSLVCSHPYSTPFATRPSASPAPTFHTSLNPHIHFTDQVAPSKPHASACQSRLRSRHVNLLSTSSTQHAALQLSLMSPPAGRAPYAYSPPIHSATNTQHPTPKHPSCLHLTTALCAPLEMPVPPAAIGAILRCLARPITVL